MARQTRGSDAAVTGVATGSLGTGTALDDTQVYSVDALATAEPPEALAAPAPVVIRSATISPLQRRHRITGGYPVGILTAGVVALLAVAAVLTLRDGGFVGSGGTGPGLAGAASFPPPPSFGAVQTAAPKATRAPKHHGHGHGQDSQ
jgi:hypothetical protein